MQKLVEVYINNMPRDQKTKMDELSKLASMKPLVNTSLWFFKPYKHRPSWRWKCMCGSKNKEPQYTMNEIHEGICGNRYAPKILAAKVLRSRLILLKWEYQEKYIYYNLL